LDFDLKHYSYSYPRELVAQTPAEKRETSRLLERSTDGEFREHQFSDIKSILPPNTLLVFNESKVFPCRLRFESDGTKAEIFLLECLSSTERSSTWKALLKPYKKLLKQKHIHPPLPFEIVGEQLVGFECDQSIVLDYFSKHGDMPLPPYIQTTSGVDRYQCVYAKTVGSVAAPTAGLHFSDELMQQLTKVGIELAFVCLHVGAGTFMPVRCQDIRDHVMHTEHYYIRQEVIEKIKQHKGPVVAVGTTSFRAVESYFLNPHSRPNTWLQTQLFVYPGSGFSPRIFSGIITNFHLPESTLLMMIGALIGREESLSMYQYAIDQKYRLFSFGDASLLWL
jgi:S-adenosylmethionine:tRNA ribosyltransferase-isomerase